MTPFLASPGILPILAILPGRLDPLFPDEAGFMETSIGGLPLPVDLLEFFAVVDQQRPNLVQDAFVIPAAHRPMHG